MTSQGPCTTKLQISCCCHATISPINPVRRLRALDRRLGRFIDILLRQVEQGIQRALVLLEVAAAVGIEASAVHHLGEADALALLHLLDAAGVARLSWLFRDGPVGFLGPGHAEGGCEHVFLAGGEGVDVDDFVCEV